MRQPALPKMSPIAWAAVAAGGGLLLYALLRKREARADGSEMPITEALAHDVFGLVEGVFVGAVKGAGAVVGVPDTNAAKCQEAQLDGAGWAVTKYCPAADAAAWLWEQATGKASGKASGKATKTTGGRVLTTEEKNWEFNPFGIECVGGICGPTWDQQAGDWWASDAGLYFTGQKDFSGEVLRPAPVAVAGLRG